MIQKSEAEIMSSWVRSEEREPLVSIRCMTFNHKNYIARAIDSFLEQITNFPFEIIIHDDCSTDGTTEIVKEYEKLFPNIIRAFYEDENQYSKQGAWVIVIKQIAEKCKGKYIASCEGDDYWISQNKLQKQFDALKDHPNISVCTCKTLIDSSKCEASYSEKYIPPKSFDIKESRVITDVEMAELIFGKVVYPFHTSGYFYTKAFFVCDKFDELRNLTQGDEVNLRKAIAFGGVYYIDEVLSCYRWMTKDGWTKRYFEMSMDERYELAKKQTLANSVFDELTSNKYHELIVQKNFSILVKWIFSVDTKKVLYDISTIVGKDAYKNTGKKNLQKLMKKNVI